MAEGLILLDGVLGHNLGLGGFGAGGSSRSRGGGTFFGGFAGGFSAGGRGFEGLLGFSSLGIGSGVGAGLGGVGGGSGISFGFGGFGSSLGFGDRFGFRLGFGFGLGGGLSGGGFFVAVGQCIHQTTEDTFFLLICHGIVSPLVFCD